MKPQKNNNNPTTCIQTYWALVLHFFSFFYLHILYLEPVVLKTAFPSLSHQRSPLVISITLILHPSISLILERAWLTHFPAPGTLPHCWLKTRSRCCVNAQRETHGGAHADKHTWQHTHTKWTLTPHGARWSNFRNGTGTCDTCKDEQAAWTERGRTHLKVRVLFMPDRKNSWKLAHKWGGFQRTWA